MSGSRTTSRPLSNKELFAAGRRAQIGGRPRRRPTQAPEWGTGARASARAFQWASQLRVDPEGDLPETPENINNPKTDGRHAHRSSGAEDSVSPLGQASGNG